MGRYKNKPRDERLCSGCLKVENEVHFLFEFLTWRATLALKTIEGSK